MMSPFAKITDIQQGGQRNLESERRKALKLVYYWDHLRGQRPMPIEDDLDVDHEMIRDIWNQCFIVQIRDLINKEFNYTYLGPAIVDAYERDFNNIDTKDMVSLNASKLVTAYQEVIETVRPVIHSGEFDNGSGNLIKFRQCLLPLGKDNKVEVILGYLNYYLYTKL